MHAQGIRYFSSSLRTLIGSCLLALLAASCGSAPPRKPLTVAYGNAPPMIIIGASGKPTGFAVEMLQEAAKREGIDLAWKPGGSRVKNEEDLTQGSLDLILTGYATPERRARFFVSAPWWSTEIVILTPTTTGIRTSQDLKGKRLAMPLGSLPTLAEVLQGSEILPSASAALAVETACQGQADAAIIANIFVRDVLYSGNSACRGISLRTIDTKLQWEYSLVSRREVAEEVQALRDRFEEMTADGTMAALAATYPVISSRYAARMAGAMRDRYYLTIQRILIGAASVILILAAIAIFRLNDSRKKLKAANLTLQQDLERRMRVERALRESEARFRALFENAPEAVIAFGQTGAMLFANPRAAVILERSPEALTGTHFEELFPERLRAILPRLAGGTANARDLQGLAVLRPNGTELPVQLSAAPILVNEEELTLVFFSDISERISLETQLRQAQKLESIGQLAGGVAHDFNNLLTVIGGNLELARMSIASNEPADSYLDQIARASTRAVSLTRQLLSFARRQKVTPAKLNLNEALRDVAKMLLRLIGADVSLEMTLEANQPVTIMDPGQFEQVIVNLAINARDAMPRGGRLVIHTSDFQLGSGDVHELAGLAAGDYVLVAVSDTGEGMAPEVKTHIFEPFFTTKEVGKGTGLGLSTVYGIVKQCGGSISVYSEPNQGTSFNILLPALDAPGDEETRKPAAKRVLEGTETILVAEDDEAVRRFVCGLLARHGYRVLETSDPNAALEAAQAEPGAIHLLLTDVVMPYMSGMDLRTRFSEMRPGVPALLMSGYSARLRTQPLDAPSIEKPFSPAALLTKIRDLLDGVPEPGSSH
ncbi:ATP-binding protein [Paludibaculum fermentans]|uniref:ATP-binding protein n=1 Tax=Paludibaculum fermentans TaxID=1473598 RepID=UPI003EBA6BBE